MKTIRFTLLFHLSALLLFAASSLYAQRANPNVTWQLLNPSVSGAPGEVVQVKVQAKIAAGSHMYTTRKYPDDALGPQATVVTVGEKSVVSMSGGIKGSKAIKKMDEAFEMETEYWEGTATLTVPVKIAKSAQPGQAEGWVNFYFQTCNETQCQPPSDQKLTFKIDVKEGTNLDSVKQAAAAREDSIAQAKTTADSARLALAAADSASTATSDTARATPQQLDSAATAGAADAETNGQTAAPAGANNEIEKAKEEGLIAFMLLAAVTGLGALATPCVFPMIPITVSFFTKRKHTTRGRNIRDAGLYALGIILTFTALGLILTLVLGATGAGDFASHPITNLVIAAVFLLLALNLFGLFEIQLPTSLINKLNRQAEEDSIWGVVLMGFIFSLTSFTCTFGFVGTLLVSASKGDYFWPILGTATFATVFAAPFFFLALFPGMMKSMPKSGGWLNSVKVVMGFLEVAFAMKFISNADMSWGWEVFTRGPVLAIWTAVAVLISVYLLGRFQLTHDTPVERVGPVRVLFSTAFLAIAFWLLTGLFDKSLGELDAQLPPASYGTAVTTASASSATGVKGAAKEEHEWIEDDYQKALQVAQKSGKPLFVDFTGYNCTNCRWMELRMFPRPDISELMSKYVLVRLYTDRPNEINKRNQTMMLDRFKTVALPYYVLISPTDSTIAEFPGMTRKEEQFVEFLRKGITSGEMASRD